MTVHTSDATILATDETEEGVKAGIMSMRKRAGVMFDMLNKMHKIMEKGCTIDMDNQQVDFTIKAGEPAVDEWLKEFNDRVAVLAEEEDLAIGSEGDKINLTEAMEAMTFYITALLHQLVPFDVIRDACIHHAQHSDTRHEREEHPIDALVHALGQALGGRVIAVGGPQHMDDEEDPFKDVPELGDGDTLVVPPRSEDE